jgi:ATP-dependent helicase HrpB
MGKLPLQPRLGRLLLEGQRLGATEETALAAAMLGERDTFLRPPSHVRRGALHVSDSDVLDRVAALVAFDEHGGREATGGTIDRNAARVVLRTREQILRLLDDKPDGEGAKATGRTWQAGDPDEAVLRAILAAFPDRVARRRESKSPRALMVGGRGVRLSETSAVRKAELFVCVELEETGKSEALVRQASAIDVEWLPAELVRRGVEVEFDAARERVIAFQRTWFEDLVIAESITSVPKDADVASILAREAIARWQPGWLCDEDSNAYLARLHSLRQWMPELELPLLDDAALQSLLPELSDGCTALVELRQGSFLHAIKSRMTAAQLGAVEREAPERLVVSSGSRIALVYEPGKPPVLAVRIQELFGMRETPRIAGGRVSVVLHLLAPNYRPQQITTDLASFWRNTYAEVRKELRRRYPKHAWPEDPLAAKAERKPGTR